MVGLVVLKSNNYLSEELIYKGTEFGRMKLSKRYVCPRCSWGIWKELASNTHYECPMCSATFKVRWEKEDDQYVLIEQSRNKSIEPLALPKGSVRALIILTLSPACWFMILLERDVPDYLLNLILIALGYYFARRNLFSQFSPSVAALAEGEDHPLNLPEGWVRGTIILGFTVCAGYLIWLGTLDTLAFAEFYVIFAGMVIGFILLRATADHKDEAWYHTMGHLKASLAIILTFVLFFYLVSEEYQNVDQTVIRVMIATIGFYFGSR